jgi:hypothetical protein
MRMPGLPRQHPRVTKRAKVIANPALQPVSSCHSRPRDTLLLVSKRRANSALPHLPPPEGDKSKWNQWLGRSPGDRFRSSSKSRPAPMTRDWSLRAAPMADFVSIVRRPIPIAVPFPGPVFAKARSGRRRIQVRAAKGALPGPSNSSIRPTVQPHRPPPWASRDAVQRGVSGPDFLKIALALAAGATSMPAVWSPAKSRTCQETRSSSAQVGQTTAIFMRVDDCYEASCLPRRGNDSRWPRAPNCACRTPPHRQWPFGRLITCTVFAPSRGRPAYRTSRRNLILQRLAWLRVELFVCVAPSSLPFTTSIKGHVSRAPTSRAQEPDAVKGPRSGLHNTITLKASTTRRLSWG